jgi:hypothetical protein
VAFNLPDIPPGAREQIGLVLELVPGDTGPRLAALRPEHVEGPMAPPNSYRVIAHTDGRYVHEFPFAGLTTRQVVVEDRLAGPPELGPAARGHLVFLPTMLRNYSPWWPQSVND